MSSKSQNVIYYSHVPESFQLSSVLNTFELFNTININFVFIIIIFFFIHNFINYQYYI